jgi:hypothetical protein
MATVARYAALIRRTRGRIDFDSINVEEGMS